MSRLLKVAKVIDALAAVMVNELKIISREPGGFAMLVIYPYLVTGGMAFVASFFSKINGLDFLRQFIGFEIIMLSVIMVQAGARFLREERNGGRLEYLLASPTPMHIILLATSLSMSIASIGAFITALIPLMAIYYGALGVVKSIIASILTLLGLIPLFGLGLIMAGVALRLRDIDALMNVVTSVISLLSAATYPAYILPQWLKLIIRVFPMYPLYDTLLGLLLSIPNIGSLTWLLALIATYGLMGLYSYGLLEGQVRRRGV